MASGGLIRDLAAARPGAHAATGYQIAYGVEVVILLVTVLAMQPLLRDDRARTAAV